MRIQSESEIESLTTDDTLSDNEGDPTSSLPPSDLCFSRDHR